MLVSSICFIAVFIMLSGCLMIYNSAENGIENELSSAAHTVMNLYEYKFKGNYSTSGSELYKGDVKLTESDFTEICGLIGCSEDLDFTIFINETRLFTSVKNSDGTNAVGTHAAENVTENVIGNSSEYYYRRVSVNETQYLGFYIPIFDQNSNTIGMIFAGKPLDSARSQTMAAMLVFIIVSAVILTITLIICTVFLDKIVAGLTDIRNYISRIANGDFTAVISDTTVERTDEIGEIGSNARLLCSNLRDMVERDPLTTLLNRRSCRSKLDELTCRRIPYTAVMSDLDFFKKINDSYGHATGDMVLKAVSSILKDAAQAHAGYAARWGGEEFLMVFPYYSVDESYTILYDILERIRNHSFTLNDKTFSITMTMGMTEHIPTETVDETINRADNNLYQGKLNGRNCIVHNNKSS